jgi:LAO/AO transport system kinase
MFGAEPREEGLVAVPWSEYFQRFLQGDVLASGRLMNLVENGGDAPEKRDLLRACSRLRRSSYVVGITGVPGAGKSTLVDALGCWLMDQGYRIGVVCIDPSSPFRGGALLGDRVRFTNLSRRKGCFIRSMATRGHLGGTAAAARDVVDLLQAAGNDIVLVETVGVGQTEVEVIGIADTVVLVTVPGLGDQIQVAKAGIMEIGHVFVVNKADHPEAEQTVQALKNDIAAYAAGGWIPPVVPTVATRGSGIPELGAQLLERLRYLADSGELEVLRRARRVRSLDRVLAEGFSRRLSYYLTSEPDGAAIRAGVELGEIDPYDAARAVWRNLFSEEAPADAPPVRAGEPGSAGAARRQREGKGGEAGRHESRTVPHLRPIRPGRSMEDSAPRDEMRNPKHCRRGG